MRRRQPPRRRSSRTRLVSCTACGLHGVLHRQTRQRCASEAAVFEEYAVEHGVAAVRAEAAIMWLGAQRLDKVAEMIGAFTVDVIAALPRDSDWLLTLQCLLEGAVAVTDHRAHRRHSSAFWRRTRGHSVVNAGAVMWHGVTDDTLARGLRAPGRHRHSGAAPGGRRWRRTSGSVPGWWQDRLDTRSQTARRPEDLVVHLHEQPSGLWLVGREA